MKASRSMGRKLSRVRLLVVSLVAVSAMFVVSACGSSSSNSTNSARKTSSTNTASAAAGARKGFKVAVLTPGTANDESWGQAITDGAKAAGAKYGAKVTVADNLNDPSQYQQQATAFAQAGYNLIINANASMGSVTQQLSKQFPSIKFGQVGVALTPLAGNESSDTPIFQDGTFEAGVLAGLMTKTNKVGAIGGFNFPVLTSEMEGFALGVRYANPKATIQRTYLNSWTDVGVAKAAAQAQASKGADIIFSATDQATQGMYQLAQSGGMLKYVIPQYIDEASQAPTVVPTSVLYNLQGAAGRFIDMYGENQWKSQNATLGVAQGVELAPYGAFAAKIPAAVQKRLAQVKADIASGKLKIPSLAVLGKSGSADKIDIKSLGS